jgi:hypothetical protein
MAKNKENAMIEVRDVVLWPQHVHGAPALRERLLSLGPEAVVRLRVDGSITTWSRMKDGKDGRPASGLRPCDEQTRSLWRQLYGKRRGELVSIGEA